jgi:hypothetical protein
MIVSGGKGITHVDLGRRLKRQKNWTDRTRPLRILTPVVAGNAYEG